MKKLLLGILAVVTVFSLTACGKTEEPTPVTETPVETTQVEEPTTTEPEETTTEEEPVEATSKEDEIGTAGSNIPLKDNEPKAKEEIEAAVTATLKEAYGDKAEEIVVRVTKIYTVEDEQATDVVKDMNLGANEVAFEVEFDVKPSEGTDVNELTIPNGEVDEACGMSVHNTRLGVLRPNEDGEGYQVTDFGTGW